MSKYVKNSVGKLDCPHKGCDRVGINGFDTPQALGAHRRHEHNVGAHGPMTVTLPPKGKKPKTISKWRGKSRIAHSPVPHVPDSNGHGMALALTLWDMTAIQQANTVELRGVFDAIIARRELLGTAGTL